jgi:hypothetical protein
MADTQAVVTRDEALAAIARQQALWDDLAVRVGPERMHVPGAMGEWTFKDLADHLTIWDQHELARVRAAFTGAPEPVAPWAGEASGDDEINAWIQARTRTRSDETVLAEAHALFDELAALVRQMPEEYLNSQASLPWAEGYALGPALVSGDWYGHFRDDHQAEVEAWLASLPSGSDGRG